MDTQLETKIYKNYRAALRAINNVHYGRAAERRNDARKVTVARYNIPFDKLKEIIKKHDEINGVTHEHTPQYSRELELREAQKAYDAHPVPCHCGSTDMVRPRWSEYEIEIHDNFEIRVSCYVCYREACLDV